MRYARFSEQRGQATVEFSFALLFVAAFLFVLTDISIICFDWISLQYAANEAARYGATGRHDMNAEGNALSREASILSRVQAIVPTATVSYPDGSGAGGARQFVRLRLENTMTLSPVSHTLLQLMGNRGDSYPIRVETVVRNEPFDTA